MFWTDEMAIAREPLRQNRWWLLGISEPFVLKECSKPSYSVKVTECTLINDVYRFPGIKVWKPIKVKTLSDGYSMRSVDSYKYANNFLENGRPGRSTSDRPNKDFFITNDFMDKQHYIDISKGWNSLGGGLVNSGPPYISLLQVDSQGIIIETWRLYNPFVSDTEFGNLTYESDNFVEISFNINYDFATLNEKDGEEQIYKTLKPDYGFPESAKPAENSLILDKSGNYANLPRNNLENNDRITELKYKP